MRRLLFVLLGLVLLGGAAATFGYRWFIEPSRTAQVSRPGASPSARSAAPKPSHSANFETMLNVANLVVGVVGIWLTLSGLRARRS